MIRRWDPILPGCCWLYEPPPISDQRWGWGCHTLRGGIDPGITMFVPSWLKRWLRRKMVSGDGTLSSAVAAGSTITRQSSISQWGWSFRTFSEGIDLGYHRFVPGSSNL